MILDSLRNWAFYCGADSRLKRALEYLAAADLNTLEPGRYEIEGAEIFMKVTEGERKREEEASLEVHDKYIGVQVLIAGEVETMGWRERRFRSRGRPCSDDRSGTDQKGGRKGDEIGACAAVARLRKR